MSGYQGAGKKRVKKLATKHGLAEDDVRAMTEFDPTCADKFLGWITEQVVSGEITLPTDGSKLKATLKDFGRKGKLTGEPDINKWTFSRLAEKLSVTESKGEVERYKVKEGQRVFYDEPPWKVVKITTPEASDKLCRPEWCIKDEKYWGAYGCGQDAPAYLVFMDGEKYAIIVPHKGELKDMDNESLEPIGEFVELFKRLNPRMKTAWISDFVNLEHLVKPIEEIMANPESAYRHARFIVKGRWPDGETAISGDPWWAYMYANDVVNGRWLEGEYAIASCGAQDEIRRYGELICDPRWAEITKCSAAK